MKIQEFAEKHGLKTRRDECGDVVVIIRTTGG